MHRRRRTNVQRFAALVGVGAVIAAIGGVSAVAPQDESAAGTAATTVPATNVNCAPRSELDSWGYACVGTAKDEHMVSTGDLTKRHDIDGEGGSDVIDDYGADSLLHGDSPYDDTTAGAPGNDTINGRGGDDEIRGMPGNDTLNGGAGNDELIGGAGQDTINGGAGDDTIDATDDRYGNNAMEADKITCGDGVDTVTATSNDTFTDRAACEKVSVKFLGTAGPDTVDGGPDADDMTGLEGDDVLTGNGGNDSLSGGPGKDTLNGGAGDDAFYANEYDVMTPDVITCGAGSDHVVADFADVFRDRAACEEIRWSAYGTGAADAFDGGPFDDWLNGGGGNDTINGKGGSDRIDAGAGADVVTGGDGTDYIYTNTMYGNASDGAVDRVTCGPGIDYVYLTREDVAGPDCEKRSAS